MHIYKLYMEKYLLPNSRHSDNCDCFSPILLYRGFVYNDTPIKRCNFTSPFHIVILGFHCIGVNNVL